MAPPDESTTLVAAAATHVGKVRDHNEDAHLLLTDEGVFLVCDGMGGHAAGEVASNLAVKLVREAWTGPAVTAAAKAWAANGTPEAKRALLNALRAGVTGAHERIVADSLADPFKRGMGTTFVGMFLAGGDAVFAHAGDSRAYLVRDGFAVQLTEDHTLLARLAAAGIDVTGQGEESRWKGVLTNALGIGDETRVSTFVVPLSPGDRFLLCSDGVTEYVDEDEVGDVLVTQASPGRAVQRLVELALERGGADNATAIVVRVLEVGTTKVPAARRQADDEILAGCALLARLSPPQRLRALRIATERELTAGDWVPAATYGDRVAWILLDGEVDRGGAIHGPGAVLYPESLLGDRPAIDKDHLGQARTEVRALALRRDDFRELTDDEHDLAEPLFAALAALLAPP